MSVLLVKRQISVSEPPLSPILSIFSKTSCYFRTLPMVTIPALS